VVLRGSRWSLPTVRAPADADRSWRGCCTRSDRNPLMRRLAGPGRLGMAVH
jgi:hypothetical protein